MQQQQQAGVNYHPFKTNFADEVKTLNDCKTNFKLISNMVIQDLYNVLQDANLVEEILKMTFPKLFDSKAEKMDE